MLRTTAKRLEVLLVTEDLAVAIATQQRIQAHHQVRVALSPLDAIAQIKRRAPDVVVCDHAMTPVTGEELFEIIATFFPAVRRVLQVEWSLARASAPNVEQLLVRGLAEAVVERPSSLEQLLAAIEA
jgi:CheY-like chemotaxis protein